MAEGLHCLLQQNDCEKPGDFWAQVALYSWAEISNKEENFYAKKFSYSLYCGITLPFIPYKVHLKFESK